MEALVQVMAAVREWMPGTSWWFNNSSQPLQLLSQSASRTGRAVGLSISIPREN